MNTSTKVSNISIAQNLSTENLPNEVWKDIPEYEGMYQISNLGRLKSLSRLIKNTLGSFNSKDRILNRKKNKCGYLEISLRKDNKKKTFLIHRLVAYSFLKNLNKDRCVVVNHKNFIRHDNRLENLEIISQRENTNKKHLKSSSKYVGVSYRKDSGKWRSIIHVNGKSKSIGTFTKEIDAHNAYQDELKQIEIEINNNKQYL